MQPIIAAFDEHDQADSALRWCAELAHLNGAELQVVTVFEPTYAEIAPDWFDDSLRRRKEAVSRVLADVGASDAKVIVLSGSDPIASIEAHVREHDATMVAIGAHTSGGPGGLGASNPAHHMIQHCSIPVAVIRPDYQPLAGGQITVGVDGSSANSVALECAERFARIIDGDIHAVFAYDPIDDTFPLRPEGWHRHSDEVRGEVAKVTSDRAKLYLAAGHPADVLIEHAQREGSAAIVVGTRGRGGFHGLRVGRVPMQLVAHATCPVIVVPH